MMNPRDIPPHFYLEDPSSTSIAGPSSYPYINMDQSYSNPIPLEDEDENDENIFRDMTFDEVLEDLNARFLVNLPKEEMTLVRIYWQAEQAHWFYEDYLRPLNPHLPSLGQRHFTQLIIASSPIYASLAGPEGIDYDGVWSEYISYKSMVPCCGGILLNEDGDKCLMVRGWKSSAGWCFPRGKININEPEVECAIREVEEEVGFDLTGRINEKDQIQTQINAQVVTMFIVPGIDEQTTFEAQTRKEIGAIEWVRLTDLPTWTGKRPKKTEGKTKKFYNVTPFVGPLKRWLQQRGYNPHPNSTKKPKQQPNQLSPQSHLRTLQPYFDPSSSTSHPTQHKPSSALDSLFDRFINKQEEDLRSGTAEGQRAGLERLFGNLEIGSSGGKKTEQEKENHEEEDLARLLGGVGYQSEDKTLGQRPRDEKANKLLSLLKPAKEVSVTATPTASQGITQLSSEIKPHQASLLSLLSSPPSHSNPPSTLPTTSSALFPTSIFPPQNTKPISLPTSPRPPSVDEKEAERREKQRRLLEMTIAGIGLDSSAPAQPSQTDQRDWGSMGQSINQGTEGVHPTLTYPTATGYPTISPVSSGGGIRFVHPTQQTSPTGGSTAHYSPSKSQHSSDLSHTRQSSSSPTKRGLQATQPGQPGQPGPSTYGGQTGQQLPMMAHTEQPYPYQNQNQNQNQNVQSHIPHNQAYRPPPPPQYPPLDPIQQQRLLSALHPRPPPHNQPSGQSTGYTGYRPPIQSQQPIQQLGLGQAVRGYQMGVPGQPGQPGPPIVGAKTNQPYPPAPMNHTSGPSQVWQNHNNPGWNPSQPPVGPNPSIPPPRPTGFRPPNNPTYAPTGPTHHQPPIIQHTGPQQSNTGMPAFGQYQPRPPSHGPGQTGTGMLQPVPVPRGAALGLLAMINGDTGR